MTNTTAGELQELLRRARESWPITGGALCVIDRRGELTVVVDGLADIAAGRPVDEHTRFEIGSISKSFASLVLLQLAEEGRVELDAPVDTYLPWFEVGSDYDPITLRHLLQHTSGLITGADAQPDATAQVYGLRDTRTGSAPGELFHYSNVGYLVIGLVIEAVTGASLARVLRERLLVPLAMTESIAEVTFADREVVATGYQGLHDDRLLLPGDPLVPAPWLEVAGADGNIAATASDLGRYARMLLGRGEVDARPVVSRWCFEQAVSELAPGGEPSVHPSRYGLGINIEQIDGHHCLTHGGGMVGYAAFLAVDLDAGVGVALLTNAPGECAGVEQLARQALALARSGSAPAAPPRTTIAEPTSHLGAFVGSEREFTVREAPGATLELTSAGRSGLLVDTGQDRLGCTHPDWRQYPLRLVGGGAQRRWTYGPYVLVPAGRAIPPPASVSPITGRYRSYTPWYPSLSIVSRDARLYLTAGAGVEAHTDEPELIELAEGTYRIGADPRLPERLVSGPIIDGRAIWIERDGCRYTRAFRA